MKTLSLALLTAACFAAGASAQVRIDDPKGGWRVAPIQQQDFLQEVHYPASNVNSNAISAAALIRGHIAGVKKSEDPKAARRPATLVVDGISMPMVVGDDGRFERPWSFGSGAHGIEVRSPDGQQVKRTTFFEAQKNRVPTRLRVILNWSSDNTDLDLHVVSPDGEHVFYGNRVSPNGGALDVDVTTGFGPEIYATPAPVQGVYHVYVNYYGSGERRDVITVAQVTVVQDEGTSSEKQQVFRVPMRKPGELTLVRSFIVP